jgi:hypothetical protein
LTSNPRRLEKDLGNQQTAWIPWHDWFFGLHALDLEELSSRLEGSIPRKGEGLFYHFIGSEDQLDVLFM